MKFRRDSDIEACGASIIFDAGGGVREVACMRVEGHKGEHISLMCDAAKADGVCHACREPIPRHSPDCFVLGTVPDDLVDELLEAAVKGFMEDFKGAAPSSWVPNNEAIWRGSLWNCLREAVLKGTTLTKPTPAVNEDMLKELEQAFATYEFDNSVCGDRKVLKLTAPTAANIARNILKR